MKNVKMYITRGIYFLFFLNDTSHGVQLEVPFYPSARETKTKESHGLCISYRAIILCGIPMLTNGRVRRGENLTRRINAGKYI